MKEPFITIVTVCYNSERTIEKTLQSVLDQNFQDYEYLIIDGKSKDLTLDIIKKYEHLFKGRLKWISEPDKGIYDAMNKGIKMAKGIYVWLVNSDDYIEPNALEVISDFVKNNLNSKVISGTIEYFNEETGKRKSFGYTSEESDLEFLRKRMGISHPATIVSKEIYEKYGTYDDRFFISADMDWFLRIKEHNIKINFIQDKLSNMSDGGISGQNDNIKKRIHDWKLLYSKHTKSKIEYWKLLLVRIITYYKTFVFKC